MCGKPWVRDRYTPYAEGFTTAVATLAHLRRKRKGFSELLHKCTMSESLDGLALDDLLIMPIQRLPRYVMLLEDLLRNTPNGLLRLSHDLLIISYHLLILLSHHLLILFQPYTYSL